MSDIEKRLRRSIDNGFTTATDLLFLEAADEIERLAGEVVEYWDRARSAEHELDNLRESLGEELGHVEADRDALRAANAELLAALSEAVAWMYYVTDVDARSWGDALKRLSALIARHEGSGE